MIWLMNTTLAFALSLVLATASFAVESPIPVISDTDIDTDCDDVASAPGPTQILIVVGPSTHPPGSHEVAAGARLMAYCLEHADNLRNIKATVVSGWPDDDELLTRADSIIFIGDTFPPQRLPETDQTLARIELMMQRGCGIVCVHFATALSMASSGAPTGISRKRAYGLSCPTLHCSNPLL